MSQGVPQIIRRPADITQNGQFELPDAFSDRFSGKIADLADFGAKSGLRGQIETQISGVGHRLVLSLPGTPKVHTW